VAVVVSAAAATMKIGVLISINLRPGGKEVVITRVEPSRTDRRSHLNAMAVPDSRRRDTS